MRLIYILFLIFIAGTPTWAQSVDPPQALPDSLEIPKDSKGRTDLEKTADQANRRFRERYQQQIALSKQSQLFANLHAVFQRARDYLKRGLDTVDIEKELNEIEKKIATAGDGIFINPGSIQTARNISTSSTLLLELADRNKSREKEINHYLGDLEEFRNTIDSLASDSLLFFIPADTSGVRNFITRITSFQKDNNETDTLLNHTTRKMQALHFRVENLKSLIQARLEDIESFHLTLSKNTIKKEVSYFWENSIATRSWTEILKFSFEKNILVLNFYLKNHSSKFILLAFIILALASFLRSLRKNIVSEMGENVNLEKRLTLDHPILSAALITLSLGQFIFPSPPFAFYVLIWTVSSVCLTIILWNFISPFWMRFWMLVLIHFLLACFFNTILQPSRLERWGMLALAGTGLVGGIKFLSTDQKSALKEKRLLIFLWLFVVLESLSILANIGGAYNLSKSLLTSGYFNLVVGILLLWTITLLHELFRLSAEAYRHEKRRYFLDFTRMESEVPGTLYYLLGLGWFILIGSNFYIYKQITDPVIDFFVSERTIGKYSFSLGNIVLFIGIIVLAGLASKLVSYFGDDSSSTNNTGKKNKIGSWMLLIRIAIIVFGIFLAFAATGLPMDRIAIVFGALSVGIGFGLQNLVNNLVSGLIIAFEKPLNVGDVVEVGGRSGTMKSIGFRSSVISTFDGSEVVIPNGDLLNQHLVNWTLNSTTRRVEVLVGVDYGAEIENTIGLVMEIMKKDKRILFYPAPQVLVKNFSASSIDLSVLFWVDNKDNWLLVKSDIMREIRTCFAENNINIPFPQMVLHSLPQPPRDETKKDPI